MLHKQQSFLNTLRALIRDEQGVAPYIDFLAMVPMVMLTWMIGWQVIYVGYTGVVAAGAAREGARAAAVGSDVTYAVTAASPGFDGRREWMPLAGYPCTAYGGGYVTIMVRLEVPHVTLPLVGKLNVYPHVKAEATARCEIPYQSF